MSDFSEMESLGEEQVRLKLASCEWGGTQAARARHWLEMKASSDIRKVAKRANTIAIIAIIIAVLSAIANVIFHT